MPKAKVAKKPVKKVVKKTIVAKSAPKLSKPVTKKRSLFFRLAIAAVLVFLAGSLYQLFANGTGPLSFFTGSSDIFVVNQDTKTTCELPDGVCQTVKGCDWKQGPATTESYPVDCTPNDCASNRYGCKYKYTNTTSTTTVYSCSGSAGTTQGECVRYGGKWIGTPKTTTTTKQTCDGTHDEVRSVPGTYRCVGTPIVATTPVVNAPSDPCASACIANSANPAAGPGTAACRACAGSNPNSVSAQSTVVNTTPQKTDPCLVACTEGTGTGKNSAACKACANTNPDSPAAIALDPGSVKLCCTKERNNPSCNNNTGKLGTKYTLSDIIRSGSSCSEDQITCPKGINPLTAKEGITYACGYGGGGGGFGVSDGPTTDFWGNYVYKGDFFRCATFFGVADNEIEPASDYRCGDTKHEYVVTLKPKKGNKSVKYCCVTQAQYGIRAAKTYCQIGVVKDATTGVPLDTSKTYCAPSCGAGTSPNYIVNLKEQKLFDTPCITRVVQKGNTTSDAIYKCCL